MPYAVWSGVAVAPDPAYRNRLAFRLAIALFAAVVAVAGMGLAGAAPVRADDSEPSDPPPTQLTEAQLVLSIADDQLGKPYKFGATGPDSFDCSGFVYRVYAMSGLADRIGRRRMGATGYWHWFRVRGLASRSDPQPGDLIIWMKGRHTGIYVGDGVAIDAVPERGVGYRSMLARSSQRKFTAFLHVDLTR